MTILDRLLRACATGHGCRALINMKVLRTIKPHDLACALLANGRIVSVSPSVPATPFAHDWKADHHDERDHRDDH